MKVLSAPEVAEWFKGFDSVGVESEYAHADKDGLFFPHPEASCVSLEYPGKPEQFPFFLLDMSQPLVMKSNISTALSFGSSIGAFGIFLARGLVTASSRK